jgi:hypothetical protein
MSTYPPYIAYPSAPSVVRAVPNPPRLHWGWVFGLSLITFSVFGQAWMIVQSVWVRKVYGHSKALPWAIAYICILPVLFVFGFVMGILGVVLHIQNVEGIVNIAVLVGRLLIFALYLGAAYTLRGELESSPINIPLSGVMTFFFGPVYFQYHLQDYEVTDEVHQFRGEIRPALGEALKESQSGS